MFVDLVCLPIHRVMPTEQHAGVCVVKLHGQTAGGVAVAWGSGTKIEIVRHFVRLTNYTLKL